MPDAPHIAADQIHAALRASYGLDVASWSDRFRRDGALLRPGCVQTGRWPETGPFKATLPQHKQHDAIHCRIPKY